MIAQHCINNGCKRRLTLLSTNPVSMQIALKIPHQDQTLILIYANYVNEAWLCAVAENLSVKILREFTCFSEAQADAIARQLEASLQNSPPELTSRGILPFFNVESWTAKLIRIFRNVTKATPKPVFSRL